MWSRRIRHSRRWLRVSLLATLLLAVAASGYGADSLTGRARAFAGDVVVLRGAKIRLAGIEAPHGGEKCRGSGGAVDCATAAKGVLNDVLRDRTVTCVLQAKVGHGSFMGSCTHTEGGDVGAALLRAGWARARQEAIDSYQAFESEARAAGRGLWATTEP